MPLVFDDETEAPPVSAGGQARGKLLFDDEPRIRGYGASVKVGEVPVLRYGYDEVGTDEFAVEMEFDNGEKRHMRVPKVSQMDVDNEVSAREAKARALQAEAADLKRLNEFSLDPDSGMWTQAVLRQQEAQREQASAQALKQGGRLALLGERVRDEVKKPEYRGKVGGGRFAGMGDEFLKGLASASIDVGILNQRLQGDEEELRQLVDASNSLDTAMPGAVRARLEDRLDGNIVSGAVRAAGAMAPTLAGAGFTRGIATAAQREAMDAGRLGIVGAGMFPQAMGSGYAASENEAQAAEAAGDFEKAKRIRSMRDMNAIASAVIETGTEMIGKAHMLKGNKGWRGLLKGAIQEGPVEEGVAGTLQDGVLSPITLERAPDLSRVPEQMGAGALLGGAMTAGGAMLPRARGIDEADTAVNDDAVAAPVVAPVGRLVFDDETVAEQPEGDIITDFNLQRKPGAQSPPKPMPRDQQRAAFIKAGFTPEQADAIMGPEPPSPAPAPADEVPFGSFGPGAVIAAGTPSPTNASVTSAPPATITVFHATPSAPGNGQVSGYYPGTYSSDNPAGVEQYGPHVFTAQVKPETIWQGDENTLKQAAAAAGFGIHQGNGQAEVAFLKSQGFEGMRRGSEVILFDNSSASWSPVNASVTSAPNPQPQTPNPQSPIPNTDATQGVPTSAPDPDRITIRNAEVNAWRASVDLPEIESNGPESEAQWWAEAKAEHDRTKGTAARTLIERILNENYEARPHETALLIHHEAGLRQKLEAARAGILSAMNGGTQSQRDAARRLLDETTAEVQKAQRAYRDTGSISGRNLRARQMAWTRDDLDFPAQWAEFVASSPKPPTNEDVTRIAAISAEAVRAHDAVVAAEAAAEDAAAESDLDIEEPVLRQEAAALAKDAARVKEALDKQVEKAREFVARQLRDMAEAEANEDVVNQDRAETGDESAYDAHMARLEAQALAEEADTGVDPDSIVFMDATGLLLAGRVLSTMARQARDLAQFTRRALARFGEWIRPHLAGAWEAAKRGADAVVAFLQDEARMMTTNKGSINPGGTDPRAAKRAEKLEQVRKSLVTYMAGKIANGATDVATLVRQTRAEFGEMVERFDLTALAGEAASAYQALLGKSRAERTPAGVLAAEAKRRGADTSTGIDPKLARKLAVAHIAQNSKINRTQLVQAVAKDLRTLLPAVTDREVRDAMTGYGRSRKPSQDEVQKKLRELNAENLTVSKIEDVLAGKQPLRTGLQRGPATDEQRALRAKLSDLMAKHKLPKTREEQLASAQDAVKSRLKNQIADIKALLADTKQPRERRARLVYDAEMTALAKERDALQAQLDALNDPTGDKRWNERAAAAARASAENYRRRIAKGDLSGKTKSPARNATVDTAAAQNEAKQAKEEWERLRELAGIPQREKIARTEAALRARQREIRADLERAKKGLPKPGEKPLPTSAEIVRLKAENANLNTLLKLMEPPKTRPRTVQSDTARMAAAEARAEKQLAALERELAGERARTKSAPLLPSPRLRRLQAEVESLRGIRDDLREAAIPRRTDDEIALDALKKRIKTQTTSYQRKIRLRDFDRKTPRQVVMDKKAEDARLRLLEVKREFLKLKLERMLAGRNVLQKMFGATGEAINTTRAMVTSLDLSAPLRQGGILVASHPLKGLLAFVPMLKAAASKRQQDAIMDRILHRPNARSGLYERAGLYLSDTAEVSLAKMEEAYMSRWIEKMPRILGGGLLRGSGRAYATFLNQLRADVFDSLVSGLTRDAAPTLEEARAIANYVNVATGRGSLGVKHDQLLVGLNTLFFAPRYVASRFNFLTAQPLWQGNARARKAVAVEYARTLAGMGALVGVVALAVAMSRKPDDPPPVIVSDPRSSDFGKLVVGNTRVDLLAGLSQAAVFMSRMASGETVDKEGNARGLRAGLRPLEALRAEEDRMDDAPKFGQRGAFAVMAQFGRSKLSPFAGAVTTLLGGKDFMGREADVGTEARDLVTPLSLREVKSVMEDQGVPRGVAFKLLELLGAGLTVYDEEE